MRTCAHARDHSPKSAYSSRPNVHNNLNEGMQACAQAHVRVRAHMGVGSAWAWAPALRTKKPGMRAQASAPLEQQGTRHAARVCWRAMLKLIVELAATGRLATKR
eukprot:6137810-Pleurochrysis_carterae.AAC.4